MFISPETLNTVSLIFSGKSCLSVNHVAFAQFSITCFAYLLLFDNSKISLNASNINKVLLKLFTAVSASSSSFKDFIRGWILYMG